MSIYLGNSKIAGSTMVDTGLSTSSTNPVQNKVISTAIYGIVPFIQENTIFTYNNKSVVDASQLVSVTGSINPVELDLSSNMLLQKLTAAGTSETQLEGLQSVILSKEAAFDSTISPQLDVSYTSLSKSALVNMFNSMPYNVGYKKVGSPTISESGIVSGFSSSNYLISSLANPLQAGDTWEFGTKITTPASWNAVNSFVGVNTNGVLSFNTSNTGILRLNVGTTETAFEVLISSAQALSVSTTYWLKATFNGTRYEQWVSTDGENYISWGGQDSTINMLNNGSPLTIGVSYSSHLAFQGTMDITKTYFKRNGVTWFGGKPETTKTCSVVGCEGTADLTAEDKAIATGKGWSLTVA